jgi:hypothetical protein
LNSHGIYNFKFNDRFDYFELDKKFGYPPSIRRKLDNWYTGKNKNCMKRLLSCIYDKYFLVTQYKSDAQSLEGKTLLSSIINIIENILIISIFSL